jgi:fructosamine-3-kinase
MINRVEEWHLTGEPKLVVAKINNDPEGAAGLRHEDLSLRWCRRETQFPVPEVYGLVNTDGQSPCSCLLMQRLPGRHLGDATLTAAGQIYFERQMAAHLARLHEHRGTTYGHIAENGAARWTDWFAPRLEYNFITARKYLSADEARLAERLLADLPQWLAGATPPTAIHGDIWAANLIVDDTNPDAPTLSGFIDGGGLFADVDYELAYLCCFAPRSYEHFYRAYAEHHAPRPGHERRYRAYWLSTILLHVWMFGPEYLPRCREVLTDITAML